MPDHAPRVLIVEDEPDVGRLLTYHFNREGFDAHHSRTGLRFRESIQDTRPSVLVLDLMLPDFDGYRICRLLKSDERYEDLKIIILSARSGEEDILKGFACGADDYVTKPFKPKEVVARARTVLRRGKVPSQGPAHEVLRFDPLEIDQAAVEARIEGKALPLTISEFRILATLAAAPGRIFSRIQLLQQIGTGSTASGRNIDVHVRSLRKKLGEHRHFLQTARGVGYTFEAPRTSVERFNYQG
ncbi:MAG: response regulator transcription factor [Opitutales bacterium]